MITIIRDSTYNDKIRNYEIFIDQVMVGKIGDGKTKSFQVAPGNHTLQLRIDWCKSNQIQFTIADNELWFKASNSLNKNYSLIKLFKYLTVDKDNYLKLEQLT